MASSAWWPSASNAQKAMPVVGWLSSASPHDYAPMVAEFRRGFTEAGYVEDRNVTIDYMWADGQYERLPALADELVRRRVNVIVAATTPAALALKPVTSTIPIVFAIGGDPVKTGLVSSLNQPGGNLTGAAHLNVEVAPKRLELLHEMIPTAKVAALLVNPINPLAESVSISVQAAASTLGVELHVLHASTDREIDRAFESLSQHEVHLLSIGTDPFFTGRGEQLGSLALRNAMPAIFQYRPFVAAGGLMSYGGDITRSYYQAGLYVGRILKGEKPSELPVQLSTKVELLLNLKAAKALGLAVPVSLLGRADEVIE